MWRERYPLISIEDPFEEDAFDDWKQFVTANGNAVQIVGDDLYVTNPTRIKQGIASGATNSVLIKPNQIGTVTETLDVIKLTRDAKWKIIVSHRSGETNEFFIADFAVGVGADHVKFGAPARGERVAKYNRLSSIDAELLMQPHS